MLWFYIQKKLQLNYLLIGLGIVIIIDLWGVDRRYLNKDNFMNERQDRSIFTPSPADQIILADSDPDFRVLNLSRSPFQDGMTSYFHKSIGGYHGAKLLRYNELIQYHLSGNIQNTMAQLQNQQYSEEALQSTLANQSILNMLNTKYIIGNPSQPPIINQSALGHAWFVPNIQIVENADEEILSLGQADLSTTALVDQRFAGNFSEGLLSLDSVSGTIQLVNYAPGNLRYESFSEQNQLAVFSEIYYEGGWDVTIDGQPAKLSRANYVLRAMEVPAGNHIIEMNFAFKPFIRGEKISLAGSILILLILLSGLVYGIISLTKEEDV